MTQFQLESRRRAGQAGSSRGTLFDDVGTMRFHHADGRETTRVAELGRLRIAHVRSTGHDIELTDASARTLLIPLDGTLLTSVGGDRHPASCGEALLPPLGRRATRVSPGATSGVFSAVAVRLPPEVEPRGGGPGAARRRRDVPAPEETVSLKRASAGLLSRYAASLVLELDEADGAMTRARARDLAAAHLVDLLGEALGRSGTSADDASTDPVSRRRVRYAEDFMREHYGDIASLAEVAAAVGVHLRTLQGAFKAADRPSLRESLATIRLEAARARLLAAPPGTRVLDIALDCGIAHVGRFARAYARRYGETPSTTLGRASSTLGPAATRR